jgi:hypothetical protein
MYAQLKGCCLDFCLVRLKQKMEQNMTAGIGRTVSQTVALLSELRHDRGWPCPMHMCILPPAIRHDMSKDIFQQVTVVICQMHCV